MEPMSIDTTSAAPGAGAESRSARSCLTCAKAKAKCVKQTGSRTCERYEILEQSRRS